MSSHCICKLWAGFRSQYNTIRQTRQRLEPRSRQQHYPVYQISQDNNEWTRLAGIGGVDQALVQDYTVHRNFLAEPRWEIEMKKYDTDQIEDERITLVKSNTFHNSQSKVYS